MAADGGIGRTATGARQHTLKGPIRCCGVGLHSGDRIRMVLHPAEPDTGIVFRRSDVGGRGAVIPARWDGVVNARLCSVLGNKDGVRVATVEHLMAAFAGLGIDNAVVEINGPEVPAMDGSAQPFVLLIECAGVVEQDAPRRAIRVLKPVEVRDGNRYASLEPAPVFGIDIDIDFASEAVRRQRLAIDLERSAFKSQIASARTFGFLHEVEALRAAGFAKGGSLENAVVVSGDRVLNEGGLRFRDEFVRHKALDAIGDLYLAGGPILGQFTGVCSGHETNNRLLRALFADATAWRHEIVSPAGAARPPVQRPLRPALLAATA